MHFIELRHCTALYAREVIFYKLLGAFHFLSRTDLSRSLAMNPNKVSHADVWRYRFLFVTMANSLKIVFKILKIEQILWGSNLIILSDTPKPSVQINFQQTIIDLRSFLIQKH